MIEKPEAIMIHIPDVWFRTGLNKEQHFRSYYESMGLNNDDDSFYHFIGSIPVHPVSNVFVCFKGLVQYKAIIVEFLRNQGVSLPGYYHPEPRNWMITTGPVAKAPEFMVQKGFRGFRYCEMLF